MKSIAIARQAPVLVLAAALLFPVVRADEGMWTFDNPPTKQLQEKYKFTPTRAWLDHVRWPVCA